MKPTEAHVDAVMFLVHKWGKCKPLVIALFVAFFFGFLIGFGAGIGDSYK